MTLELERWKELWHAAGLKGDVSVRFEALVQHYSAPDRYYHNLQHIAECLREFDPVRHLAGEPMAVELAIWFHDVVYDSHAHDNEARSAELACEWLTVAQGQSRLIEKVRELILVTRHAVAPVATDSQMIVDVDLSILGQDETRFQQYEQEIRQEYYWVPEEVFASKRAEVLEGFLGRKRIYATDWFRKKYEERARRNLQGSIRALRE